jgi:hypothetical protein
MIGRPRLTGREPRRGRREPHPPQPCEDRRRHRRPGRRPLPDRHRRGEAEARAPAEAGDLTSATADVSCSRKNPGALTVTGDDERDADVSRSPKSPGPLRVTGDGEPGGERREQEARGEPVVAVEKGADQLPQLHLDGARGRRCGRAGRGRAPRSSRYAAERLRAPGLFRAPSTFSSAEHVEVTAEELEGVERNHAPPSMATTGSTATAPSWRASSASSWRADSSRSTSRRARAPA